MSERTCEICGRELRTGRKYCYQHRNSKGEIKQPKFIWMSYENGLIIFFLIIAILIILIFVFRNVSIPSNSLMGILFTPTLWIFVFIVVIILVVTKKLKRKTS